MSLIPRLFPEEPAQAATPRPAQQIARGTTQARYHHFALAVDILSEIAQGTVPADQVLYHHFRKLPQMGARDRGIVAESVYGVLRQRRSLAWRMGVGEKQWNMLVAGFMLDQDWADKTFVLKWLGNQGAAQALDDLARSADDAPLAVRVNLPDVLAERLLQAYSEEQLLALCTAMNQPAPVDIRVNTLKAERGDIQHMLNDLGLATELTPYAPNGLRRHDRRPLFSLPAFKEGLFEVQDEASQLVGHLVAPKPGERVLDLCAGAGGKTLQLGALMQSKGSLMATDISAHRLEKLTPRMRRAGLSNVRPVAITGMTDAHLKRNKGMFDRILIDAPCSGTGTWRRNPDLKWRVLDLEELNATQGALLEGAVRLLKPQGRLIYATCSILPEENECIIEQFLAHHPDFQLLSAADILAEQGITPPHVGDMLKLDPAQHGTDGFFAAVLQRVAATVEAGNDVV
ncbi:MAG TPA: RsmB/NOP family class I SAM-dependent RNA methyltransferase [bacterium]|nr:RsmB/NOP family class I SAM-dependent RNA methyltransferase [bacterium]